MRAMVENVKEKGKDSGKALSSWADYSGYKNWVKKSWNRCDSKTFWRRTWDYHYEPQGARYGGLSFASPRNGIE